MKKLVGRRDLEDSLKRLDKLTNEEARMATAQVLRVTHTIEERVRGVADTLLRVDDRGARIEDGVTNVDNRVAGVDERVAGVDERVAGVDERVAGVDERVAGVDDRVAGVGSRLAGVYIKVDQVQRSSSPSIINAICEALPSLQEINYGRVFTDGYPHQIHLRTITSHAVPTTKEQRPGSSKEAFSRNGCPRVRFFGFMVNLRPSRFSPNALR